MSVDNLPAPALRNRFKSELALRGHTVASWARASGFTDSLVWMNLSGERTNDDIRDAIAAVLRTSRIALDAEIAQAKAAA